MANARAAPYSTSLPGESFSAAFALCLAAVAFPKKASRKAAAALIRAAVSLVSPARSAARADSALASRSLPEYARTKSFVGGDPAFRRRFPGGKTGQVFHSCFITPQEGEVVSLKQHFGG